MPLYANGTIDYDGSIPGWRQGLAANRPARGLVIGDLYLSDDAQTLDKWDGTAWVTVLASGGSGPTPTLQQVTTAGNVTTDIVNIRNAFAVTDNTTARGIGMTGVPANPGLQWFLNSGADAFTQIVPALSGAGAVLIQWRTISGVPALLSDIPVITTPTLQQVTVAGNTSDQKITITDGTHGLIVLDPFDGNEVIGSVNGVSDGVEFGSAASGPFSPGPFWNLYANSGTSLMLFKCANIAGASGLHTINFRKIAGTVTSNVAYLGDLPHGNFTNGTFTGVTITIPHGLSFTPTFATISAKNAATAGALIGGYFFAYGATNIVVTLLVNVAVAISLNLDWSALQ